MPDDKILVSPNSPISSDGVGGENMIDDDPELNVAHLNDNDKMSCDRNNNNNDDKRLIIDENSNNRIFAKNDADKNADCDSVANKNSRLDHALDKSQKMNLLLAHHQQNFDYDERDIERDLMQVRRLTLEKAQSDLLAGFGLGFPLLGGLHYLPNGHPFLPTVGLNTKTMAPADLMNLSTLIQHQNLLTSLPPVIGHKNHSFENLRRKSSPINGGSPEPEDLSMSRNSNVLDRQKRPPPATPNDASTTAAAVRRTPSSMIAVDDYADLHSLSPADSSINAASGSSHNQQNWSFEEQFKQLYDLGSDQKRKEFLDDLFSFMQKRGTPVTRIPIMAKQVLDLYELYKLVVSHGGLVEVINKKMWREITKGLNLPSSITSAAFTLRTQYMKYLYPYECEKEKLSSPAELQSAIDGNRREGRRTGYHPYSQISPTLLPAVGRHHMNGGLPDGDSIVPPVALTQQAIAAAYREQALAIEAAQRHFELSQRENQRRATSDGASSCSNESLINEDTPMTPLDATTSPQRPSLYSGISKPSIKNQSISSQSIGHLINGHDIAGESTTAKTTTMNGHLASSLPDSFQKSTVNGLETNNQKVEPNERSTQETSSTLLPTTHIKVTSRNDGQTKVDTSLVVSMEINGVMYQGVLFAQPNA